MSRRLAIVLMATFLAVPASADAAPTMWDPFVGGSSWRMTSSLNGHVTTFGVRHLQQWGCWTGDIVDLWNVKQAAEDYWGPGVDVDGHQIMHRDRDGAWRMIGTYADSPNPSARWTMQIHRYPGRPRPYVITPGVRRDSDTRTAYYTLYRPGKIASWCLQGGEPAAPGWGREVYWRSRFTFDKRGGLRAHYEENHGCGPVACQIEEWTFAPHRAGIDRIVVRRSGGRSLSLVLIGTR